MTIARTILELNAILSEDSGDAPGSRYGRFAWQWKDYAIAAYWTVADSNGWLNDDADVRALLDEVASLVVNDSPDPARIILDRWELLPRQVRELVGRKRDVRALAY